MPQIAGPGSQKLFRKYLLILVTLVSVILIGNAGINVYFSFKANKDAIFNLQKTEAITASEAISRFINDAVRQIRLATEIQPSLQGSDSVNELYTLLRQVPAITDASYVDTRGREQARVSRLDQDVIGSQIDRSSDPRFIAAKSSGTYFGKVYFRNGSEPYISIAVAGTGPDGGVTIAELNLKFIWEVVSRIRVGTAGHAYVVDPTGTLIAHPNISLVLRNTNLSALPIFRRAESNQENLIQTDTAAFGKNLEGIEVLSAYAPVRPLDWLVFVESPVSEAYESIYSSIVQTGLVLIGALGLAFLASLFLVRKMTVPIRALQTGAARIGGGDLSQRISINTGDELEALADQFNVMAGRLQESYADLEKKVELRTQELAQSVEELRALGEVSQTINSTLDLETVLSAIVSKATQLSGTEAGAIYVFNEAKREHELRATFGMTESLIDALKDQHTEISKVVALAIEQRQPMQTPDLRAEPPSPARDILLQAGYLARLIVPLLAADRVVGALVVRRQAPGEFASNTIQLLETFAAQSVLAIQNARLFSEIEDKGRQLEVASQHKSQFLANMSHELRTPLNAIIGVTEMLREDADDLDRKDEIEPLDRVLGAGRHLLGLINDILDLSKIEAGKMEIHIEEFAIAPLIDDAVKTVATLADKNGNRLVVDCAPTIGMMETDQTRVRQALLNLLSNANKFTERGTVTVRAERHQESGADWITIAVGDTGIGMTAEQMGRLFQDFSQADSSTTRKYGGTGLGLAISRRFCQLMHGDIRVESEPGRGSTFTIRLPAAATDGAVTVVQQAAPAPNAKTGLVDAPLVLIIDDDATVREVIGRFLEREGFSVAKADGGKEGLRMARELHPEAVTLDIMMPDIDGWTVLAAIKGDPDLVDLPVILMTIVDEKNRGYALGATEYLVKPVDRQKLVDVLRALCGSGGRPLLMVDDDDFGRRQMRTALEEQGWTVTEAKDGRDALTKLGEARPDVIILDLMMPEMDGFEFLEEMRRKSEWRDIPVVVVTAKELTDADRIRLNGGVERIIQKTDRDDMLREMRSVLTKCVERRPSVLRAES